MTSAICIRCGVSKHGAVSPCRKCDFRPSDKRELAKAMSLTDRFHSRSELAAIGERIGRGEEHAYDEANLQTFIRELEADPVTFERLRNPGPYTFRRWIFFLCFGISVLLLIGMVGYAMRLYFFAVDPAGDERRPRLVGANAPSNLGAYKWASSDTTTATSS